MARTNGTHAPIPATPPTYRSQIIVTIPEDGNVEISVDGGGVVELFAAAALLERSAHRILASAERDAAMNAAVAKSSSPPIEIATRMPS